jgi:hypothetical protein
VQCQFPTASRVLGNHRRRDAEDIVAYILSLESDFPKARWYGVAVDGTTGLIIFKQ